MKRKEKPNRKFCKKCGVLKELLMFGKWGREKICLTCIEEDKSKK